MNDQDEAARRIAFFCELEREAATASNQDGCDDPDCACHRDTSDRPGDGATEVTMTDVYEDDLGWGHHPGGW